MRQKGRLSANQLNKILTFNMQSIRPKLRILIVLLILIYFLVVVALIYFYLFTFYYTIHIFITKEYMQTKTQQIYASKISEFEKYLIFPKTSEPHFHRGHLSSMVIFLSLKFPFHLSFLSFYLQIQIMFLKQNDANGAYQFLYLSTQETHYFKNVFETDTS